MGRYWSVRRAGSRGPGPAVPSAPARVCELASVSFNGGSVDGDPVSVNVQLLVPMTLDLEWVLYVNGGAFDSGGFVADGSTSIDFQPGHAAVQGEALEFVVTRSDIVGCTVSTGVLNVSD